MGETFSSSGHAETQLHASHSPQLPSGHKANGGLVANGEEEEPYTIKCICGFDDDVFDGYTVYCDRCNTWQHIACYYPPLTTLAEDFEHTCVDCNPTQEAKLNREGAVARQQSLRLPQGPIEERRVKRNVPKSHKKTKTRDSNNATNGWGAHDISAHTEQSPFSPHDQGPPSKKAKTNHKPLLPSGPASGILPHPPSGQNRSTGAPGITKPPLRECPPDYFSPEFIRVHRENSHFRPADTNLHNNIGVTNLISGWLDDPDAFAEVTGGKTHSEVFQKLDRPIEEYESPVQKHTHEDKDVRFYGDHPRWPYLTTGKDLAAFDIVGEIRGVIGRKDDYKSDPENLWTQLHHPDHFVFFHPLLPIYIDSRSEGTVLRYVRRSCKPNLELKTVITGARELRFCFMTKEDVLQGSELTTNWDTMADDNMYRKLSGGLDAMSQEDLDDVCNWIGSLMAHFGGCACQEHHHGESCTLSKWDRRLVNIAFDLQASSSKKGNKRGFTKTSPPKTNSVVSGRAASDAPPQTNNGDVDMDDGRSTSNSISHKSNKTSRDGTPSDAHRDESALRDNMESERERRKVMQSEKLFEQMDKDSHQREQKKKKRTSGSNATTPVVANSVSTGILPSSSEVLNVSQKQFGKLNASGSYPNTPLAFAKPRSGEGAPSSQTPPARRTPLETFSANSRRMLMKPTYSDASTQTEEPQKATTQVPLSTQKYIPLSKLLLRKSLHRIKRLSVGEGTSTEEVRGSSSAGVASQKGHQTATARASADLGSHLEPLTHDTASTKHESQSPSSDIDVDDPEPDTPAAPILSPPKPSIETSTNHPSPRPQIQTTHPPIKPPPPPWDSDSGKSPEKRSVPAVTTDIRSAGMHVDLPPPLSFKPDLNADSSMFTPSAPVANMIQSPQSSGPITSMPPPLTSPSAQDAKGAIKPSPVKKKLSLSEYTKRKTETPLLERRQSQGQPSVPNVGSRGEGANIKSPSVQSPGALQEGSSGQEQGRRVQ